MKSKASVWSAWKCPAAAGLEYAVRKALENSGKQIPWKVKDPFHGREDHRSINSRKGTDAK